MRTTHWRKRLTLATHTRGCIIITGLSREWLQAEVSGDPNKLINTVSVSVMCAYRVNLIHGIDNSLEYIESCAASFESCSTCLIRWDKRLSNTNRRATRMWYVIMATWTMTARKNQYTYNCSVDRHTHTPTSMSLDFMSIVLKLDQRNTIPPAFPVPRYGLACDCDSA